MEFKPRDDRHWRYLILLFIAFLPGAYCLSPAADNDYWWHLRAGEWIWQNRDVTSTDPFSRPGIEEIIPWMSYSWVFELFVYGLHAAFDSGEDVSLSVPICKTILNGITFLVISRFLLNRGGFTWRTLITLALVTVPCTFLMSERPWHFTIWSTVATLAVTDAELNGRPARRHWLLPLLYVVWANVHIQFVLGFAVLGLAGMEAIRLSLKHGRCKTELKRIVLLGLLCVLATLINPYHVRLWIVIREYATQTTALRNVMELLPPEFEEWRQWVLLGLFGVTGIVLIRRNFPIWDIVLFAACLFFSLRMRRDIWFGSVVCGLILTRQNGPGVSIAPPRWFGLLACLFVGLGLTRITASKPFGVEVGKPNAEIYPVAAVQWLHQNSQAGPIYNHFDWGGYLIWTLREYPVAIDGRTNLFGERRLLESFHTWAGSESWKENPELQAAGFVLAPVGSAEKPCGLTEKLLEHPETWAVVYRDDVAVILVPRR